MGPLVAILLPSNAREPYRNCKNYGLLMDLKMNTSKIRSSPDYSNKGYDQSSELLSNKQTSRSQKKLDKFEGD